MVPYSQRLRRFQQYRISTPRPKRPQTAHNGRPNKKILSPRIRGKHPHRRECKNNPRRKIGNGAIPSMTTFWKISAKRNERIITVVIRQIASKQKHSLASRSKNRSITSGLFGVPATSKSGRANVPRHVHILSLELTCQTKFHNYLTPKKLPNRFARFGGRLAGIGLPNSYNDFEAIEPIRRSVNRTDSVWSPRIKFEVRIYLISVQQSHSCIPNEAVSGL